MIAVAINSDMPHRGIMSYTVKQVCPVDTHIIVQARKSSKTMSAKHNHFIFLSFLPGYLSHSPVMLFILPNSLF